MSPGIEHAAELIRAGRLVAFPTETVYGLGANALDPEAVARIFAAKGRPRTSPLIVHVDSIEMARTLASIWSDTADLLARRYWPGPLTLVVPKRPEIPDIVTAGLPTVGLRMPAHPLALELIRAAGVPDRRSQRQPFHATFPHRRRSHSGVARRLHARRRPGARRHRIHRTLAGGRAAASAPRRDPDHRTRIADRPDPAGRRIPRKALTPHPACTPATTAPPPRSIWTQLRREGKGIVFRIGHEMPADPQAYAATLYETLHRLDTQALDWIAIEPPPDTPEWAGVLDRLRRAAE